jgi:hypothetical protein
MLLFRPEHKDMILSGRKIESRRLWKAWRVNVRSVQKAKLKMISPEFFAKLYIYDRWEERLGDISDESIHNEGYGSREEFFAALARINERQLKKIPSKLEDLQVKVIKFKVVP